MTDTMKKIIELCDCEWIRGKWIPHTNDWVIEQNLKSLKFSEPYTIDNPAVFILDILKYSDISRIIYLPIGFNPETCNLQIDDLLMEILKLDYRKMQIDFVYWYGDTRCNSENQNDLILKLIWLRELIDEIERGN